MDFFDTIDEYEKKMEEKVTNKLTNILFSIYDPNTYTDKHKKKYKSFQNEFFDEIQSSNIICNLLFQTSKNSRKNKYTIYSLNHKKNKKIFNNFNQKFIEFNKNNNFFFSQKNESEILKENIKSDIFQKIKNFFTGKYNDSFNSKIKPLKVIFPLKNKKLIKKEREKTQTQNSIIIQGNKDKTISELDDNEIWKFPHNYKLRKNIKINFKPEINLSPDKPINKPSDTKTNFYCLKIKVNAQNNKDDICMENNSNKHNAAVSNIFMINCKQKRILSSRIHITGRELK